MNCGRSISAKSPDGAKPNIRIRVTGEDTRHANSGTAAHGAAVAPSDRSLARAAGFGLGSALRTKLPLAGASG